MRYFIILIKLFFLSGSLHAGGISESVREALYENGFQAAVNMVDSAENPSLDEIYLSLYLVDGFDAKTSRLDYYIKSDYKQSESYRIGYYIGNFLSLDESQIYDLKSISESNHLAKIVYGVNSYFNSRVSDSDWDIKELQPIILPTYKEEALSVTLSSMLTGAYFYKVYGRGDCESLKRGSPIAYNLYRLYGVQAFSGCDISPEELEHYFLVFPSSDGVERLLSLDEHHIGDAFSFWEENSKYSPYKDFDKPLCLKEYSDNESFKKCFLLSQAVAEYCSLPFWSELDTKQYDGKEVYSIKGWRDSDQYIACKKKNIRDILENGI
ncbi:hypothetical protein [Amphritea balenae]|uniref:Uncharacterized protein n=1 Tax=Amphritea balenae TaxID=452629 RepID=A0A3P1SX88_9GAMM|nr:hypothetical protein [Amphritea balenae]RRD01668.1 hypothetical protein EHS89_03685 [Amphritea balenae]GGK55160.1 hypothetical protein GCM10007941_01500 [Amphritea balenae]